MTNNKVDIKNSDVNRSTISNTVSSNSDVKMIGGSGAVNVRDSFVENANIANTINQTINNYGAGRKPLIEDFVTLIENLANLVVSKEDEITNVQINMEAYKKITYNNLKAKIRIIEEYGSYYSLIDASKQILADKDPFLFDKSIAFIRREYLNIVQSLCLEEIKENSSAIWDQVKGSIEKKANCQSVSIFALDHLLSYAFIKCKIFEKAI